MAAALRGNVGRRLAPFARCASGGPALAQDGPTLQDFLPGGDFAERTSVKVKRSPKPAWLTKANPGLTADGTRTYERLKKTVKSLKLATVCQEAKCPNMGECWAGGTATIMVMGDTCTRACRFCSVKTSKAPPPLDPGEPEHVAKAVAEWGLNYVVLTTVDRDDLPDQGAEHLAKTVSFLREKQPKLLVETLLGDFQGNHDLVAHVVQSGMDVYAHNIETVERTTPQVRDRRAAYRQSLGVLEAAKAARDGVVTKSSIMVGCGESNDEVKQTLRDLRAAGVDIVTLGQYLQPTKGHMKVGRYVDPLEFEEYREYADSLGFAYCASGPLVRSSYRAGEFFVESMLRKRRMQEAAA
mmetsp:Transcript_37424/g.81784  ORF Transcript_37424/g.81784 Transcript_37424/m.81784 type:complete len:354 (-) Transcript_37424:476-1537(-)